MQTHIPTIILVLVSGYVFLYFFSYTKFDIKNDSGYHLFLKSALFGFPLWGLAEVTINASGVPIADERLIRSGLGVAYGIMISMMLNMFFREIVSERRAAKRRGKSVYFAVNDVNSESRSIGRAQLVEFTMKGGKAYVGLPEPLRLEDEYVDLIPKDDNGIECSNCKISLKVEEIESVKSGLPTQT